MPRARSNVGRMPGYRQVTMYVDPALYEKVRCTAYTLNEDIYELVGEALASAVERRTTKAQRTAIESMAKQNLKNGASRAKPR